MDGESSKSISGCIRRRHECISKEIFTHVSSHASKNSAREGNAPLKAKSALFTGRHKCYVSHTRSYRSDRHYLPCMFDFGNIILYLIFRLVSGCFSV